jgi:hypothetical protein
MEVLVLDLIAMAAIAATAVLVMLTLVSIYARSTGERILLASGYTAWFCVVVAIGATGLFAPGGAFGIFGLAAGVAVPLTILLWLGLGTARGREAASHAPLLRLTAIQIPRVVGLFFVLLFLAGRVSAPFGPSAGWGDVLVGLLAVLATLMVAANALPERSRRALLLGLNALGTADLLTAVTLGATSSPGPIQIFHAQATTASMLALPWILIPCFLVPSFLLLHAIAFYRLRSPQSAPGRVPLEAVSQTV